MAISVGDRLPGGEMWRMGEGGPEAVDMEKLTQGRKVVLFGLPAAFSGTCSAAHLPSFMRTRDGFAAKGVDEVVCMAVNDAFTMAAWDKDMGAAKAGVTMLGDADGSYTRALGQEFDFPPAGLYGRCKRFSMVIEDGTVTHLMEEQEGGVCELTAGEVLLDQL
ncbi:MAG: peroxiredoxin [Rhodobacterales bacterium]|nr:MAG: peroxiredoxin [Rhodobacterales bacterium]